MILADTSVWIDHVARASPALTDMLGRDDVVVHPFVIGEIAMGGMRARAAILDGLQDLPSLAVALHQEVRAFVDRHRLHGSGIGYVDAHLLVAARLADGVTLWTRDRRLQTAAVALGLAMEQD